MGGQYANIRITGFGPSFSCADVAYTDTFSVRCLGYVSTPEFTEAVRYVASGTSRYSPKEIPAGWATIAAEWSRHLPGQSEGGAKPTLSAEPNDDRTAEAALRFLRDEEYLTPALIYLASMEYRSRRGHEDVTPVFPWVLREGYAELDARLKAKRQSAEGFSRRAAAIAAKISDAERKGAGDYFSERVTRAKLELDRARREAMGVRSTIGETEAAFDRAEKIAEAISGR